MEEGAELVVYQFVSHIAAVEADIIPVRHVVERQALDLADLPKRAMTVDLECGKLPEDLDLLAGEAVPIIEEILRFLVGKNPRAACRFQFVVALLLVVVGVDVGLPLLLGIEFLL